jgi:hypothetical protein
MPFVNSVYAFSTDIQGLVIADKNADGKQVGVNTYTVDNQEVDVVSTIFFRLPVDKIEFIYQNAQDYKPRLVSIAVDRLKAEFGKVNAAHVAEKRGRAARHHQGGAQARCAGARRRSDGLPAYEPRIHQVVPQRRGAGGIGKGDGRDPRAGEAAGHPAGRAREDRRRVLSLCSGVGMHDLGLGTAFDARTVCYVEREAFAASQLVALMEAGLPGCGACLV